MKFVNTETICEAISALREGDSVVVEGRSEPMTVFEVGYEDVCSPTHPTDTVYLESGGCVYRLRGATHYPQSKDTNCPMLELRTQSGWEPKAWPITQLELEDGHEIICDIRAQDIFPGERPDIR